MDQRTHELNPAGTPPRGYRTSEQIRSDIEARRAEMDVLATCLRQRLSPEEIAHEVKRSLRSRTLRAGSAFVSSVRENPMPWLVMAGGLAWLIQQSREQSRSDELMLGYYGGATYGSLGYGSSVGPYSEPGGVSSGTYGAGTTLSDPHEHGVADTAREKVSAARERSSEAFEHGREKVAHAKDTLVDKAAHARDVVADKAAHAREAVSESTTRTRERLGEAGHRTAEQTRLLSRRARRQAATAANESPLLLALGLLGVGALIGLAIPTSRREDELMGPLRDDLLDQAKHKGEEMVHKVSRIAEVATSEVKQRVGEGEGDVGEKLVSAVEGGVGAARREAERQGLGSHDDGQDGQRGSSTSGGASSGLSAGTRGGSSTGLSGGTPSRSGSTTGTGAASGAPTRQASPGGASPAGSGSPGIGSPGRSTPSGLSTPGDRGGSLAGGSSSGSPSRSLAGGSAGGTASPGPRSRGSDRPQGPPRR